MVSSRLLFHHEIIKTLTISSALLPEGTDEAQLTQLIDETTAKLQFGPRIGNFIAKSKPQFSDADVQSAQIQVTDPQRGAQNAAYIPSFAALDKIVLRFDAYLKETMPDGNRGAMPGSSNADQEYIIRHVLIQYFLEDDSIAVVEPLVENSGLPQGVLIKRQLLPKPIEADVGMFLWVNSRQMTLMV